MTSVNRCSFVTGLAAVLAAPRGAEAPAAQKGYIGLAFSCRRQSRGYLLRGFRQGLRDLGYLEGLRPRVPNNRRR
jgi:hypothetical protein